MKLNEVVKKSTSKKYENINTPADLKKLMKTFKDNKVRTVNITFGTCYVDTYDVPSKIRYTAVSDSPLSFKGYWKKGKMYPFSEKLIIKNQQHDGGNR